MTNDKKMKPPLIQAIEKQLGHELKKLDPLTVPLLDAVRYEYNNSYCCDTEGRLVALNVSESKKLKTIRFTASDVHLEYLNLGENKNLKQVDFEVPLPQLKYADLSECAIQQIKFPAGFDQLVKLYLQKNKLKNVEFEKGFTKLLYLDVSDNKLTKFQLIAGFDKLQYLYLSGNQLTEFHIPKPLLCLEVLHLRGNLLPQLPKNLLAYSNLNNLYLHGNPLQDIPKDFIPGEENGNAWPNVKSYLISQQHGQMVHLRQAKMILVGNGEVGKSSIRIKLMNPGAKLPEKHERTPGLDIETYTLEINNRELTGINGKLDFDLCIWDFGGQGKYREVQQLFCSRKSLYLFVTAPDDTPEKEDYIGFNYWLSMVNAFSYDEKENRHSPVIHVVNKVDKEMTLVDEKTLKERFQNIDDFVKISCLKEPLLLNLKDAMRKSLRNVSDDIFNYPINQYWLDVKSELESRQKDNHIYWQDYLDTCTQDGRLTYDEAVTWIEVLDRIGTVIYFGKNEALKDLIILNPLWVKDAICQVIDSLQVRNGLLYPALLPDIWKGYSDEERKQLLEIMLAYKLCYRQSDEFGQDEYVVPSMLNDTRPRFPNRLVTPDFQLKLVWFPFIPAGTVNKLMVGLHSGASHFSGRLEPIGMAEKFSRQVQPSVYNNLIWKNNVVAHDAENDAYAHVQEDWENKTVFVNMFGEEVEPLFDYLVASFEDINQTLKNTKYLNNLSLESYCWHEGEWMSLVTLKKLKIDFFKIAKSYNNMNPIQELVAQGRLKEALQELSTKAPANLKNDVATLQSRLYVLERKEMLGTIRHDDAGIERSSITEATLNLSGLVNVPANDDTKAVAEKPSTVSKAPQVNIYFSYAWGDPNETGESREAIVNQLYDALIKDGFNVIRDKMNLEYGGRISEFMEKIGKGDLIVVFMSDKYLRSAYCMWELCEIYRNSLAEKEKFSERILPVRVESLEMGKPAFYREYFKYWQDFFTEWSEMVKDFPQQVGKAQMDEFNKSRTIKDQFGNVVGYFQDMNARTKSLLSQNDFEEVKNAIVTRLDKA